MGAIVHSRVAGPDAICLHAGADVWIRFQKTFHKEKLPFADFPAFLELLRDFFPDKMPLDDLAPNEIDRIGLEHGCSLAHTSWIVEAFWAELNRWANEKTVEFLYAAGAVEKLLPYLIQESKADKKKRAKTTTGAATNSSLHIYTAAAQHEEAFKSLRQGLKEEHATALGAHRSSPSTVRATLARREKQIFKKHFASSEEVDRFVERARLGWDQLRAPFPEKTPAVPKNEKKIPLLLVQRLSRRDPQHGLAKALAEFSKIHDKR